MSGKPGYGGQLIKDFLLENPHLPSRTIARTLYEKHPGVWSGVEAVRKGVLGYRGANGSGASPGRGRPVVIAPPSPLSGGRQAIERNPFYCPPSDEREWRPYVITVSEEDETLIICDIHFPYHNVKALKAIIAEAKRRGVKRIILNGDTLDFYQLSRFNKDPRKRSVVGEIEMVKDFLDELRNQFPHIEIIWKDGNHDERLMLYVMANAKELVGIEAITLPALLDFVRYRIEYVTEKRPIILGKNNIIHGHEYPTPMIGPVNAARGLFLRAKTNAACGHYHQVSEHSEPNLKGELVACWSIGCACELRPLYMPLNKWAHGCAFQRTRPSGDFEFDNKKIIDGRFL